jgi:hypothetical protein
MGRSATLGEVRRPVPGGELGLQAVAPTPGRQSLASRDGDALSDAPHFDYVLVTHERSESRSHG